MKCNRRGALLASLAIVADIYCALTFSGCVGATRLPTKTSGPTGTKLENNEIDFTFLQAGTTRREEVVSRLNRIDTGYSSPGMFWGRWSESKWGHWVIAAVPGGAGGSAGRNWHVHNLLVSFDENGVMQSKDLVDGEKDLERELRVQLAKAPPLDLSKPVVVPLAPYRYSDHANHAYYDLKEITFTKEGMQLKRYDEKSQIISPHDVARISYERFHGNPSFGAICHSLHLNEWHAFVGKKILFCASGASLATIIKYLQQEGPANMRWE